MLHGYCLSDHMFVLAAAGAQHKTADDGEVSDEDEVVPDPQKKQVDDFGAAREG